MNTYIRNSLSIYGAIKKIRCNHFPKKIFSLTEFISAYRVATCTLPYPKEFPSVLHRPERKIKNILLIISQVMYVLIDQKRQPRYTT